MDETTYQVILTLAFQDATSRNFKFNGVDEEAVSYGNVKNKVKAINANMPPEFAMTFVSNSGSPCIMISAAQIIAIQEEVIYNVAS